MPRKPLSSIKGIKITSIPDDIGQDDAFAVTPCGHSIGQKAMIQLIQFTIKVGKYQVKCPNKPNGASTQCGAVWDFSFCDKVADLSPKQMQQHSQKLNMNFFKNNSYHCPFCQIDVFVDKSLPPNDRRVRCTSCHSPDFCRVCRLKWGSSPSCTSSKCLGNQSIAYKNRVLLQAQQSLQFTYGKKTYKVRCVRACPKCSELVTHQSGCKHTKNGCPKCRTNFCFICTGVMENGGWPCGSYDQYCGRTAKLQRIDTNTGAVHAEYIIGEPNGQVQQSQNGWCALI